MPSVLPWMVIVWVLVPQEVDGGRSITILPTAVEEPRLVFALVPVPDSATVSGLPGALLATDSVPLAAPLAVGAKVTRTVHDPPAAMEVPQVLVWANGPLTLTEETEAEPLPGFDTVTVCATLVDPTATLPNDRLDGDADRAVPLLPPQGMAAAASAEDLDQR